MICAVCHDETADSSRCVQCGSAPLLQERYALKRVLGSGGSGTLYAAVDGEQGVEVAIKELPWLRPDSEAYKLAEREARVLRQLRHPQIPDFIDAFESGRGPGRRRYLVQSLIPGRDLEAELEERRYEEREVAEILLEVAEILVYLHRLQPPVVHRDLKPSNLMRRPDGRLVLVDFGAVRDTMRATLGGQTVAGTFGYMAPEQFTGEVFPATDLYGLGALGLRLLSREDPSRFYNHQRQLDWQKRLTLSPPLRAVLESLLKESPEDRPSARRLVEAGPELMASLEGDPRSPSLAARHERALPPQLIRSLIQQLQQQGLREGTQRGARRIRRGLAWRLGRELAGQHGLDLPSDHPSIDRLEQELLPWLIQLEQQGALRLQLPDLLDTPQGRVGLSHHLTLEEGEALLAEIAAEIMQKEGAALHAGTRSRHHPELGDLAIHEPLLAELPRGVEPSGESPESAKELTWSEASFGAEEEPELGEDVMRLEELLSESREGQALGSHPCPDRAPVSPDSRVGALTLREGEGLTLLGEAEAEVRSARQDALAEAAHAHALRQEQDGRERAEEELTLQREQEEREERQRQKSLVRAHREEVARQRRVFYPRWLQGLSLGYSLLPLFLALGFLASLMFFQQASAKQLRSFNALLPFLGPGLAAAAIASVPLTRRWLSAQVRAKELQLQSLPFPLKARLWIESLRREIVSDSRIELRLELDAELSEDLLRPLLWAIDPEASLEGSGRRWLLRSGEMDLVKIYHGKGGTLPAVSKRSWLLQRWLDRLLDELISELHEAYGVTRAEAELLPPPVDSS